MKRPVIVLSGNKTEASKWVGYATKQLDALCTTRARNKSFHPNPLIDIFITCIGETRKIFINARYPEVPKFVGIPWDDEIIEGWGSPFIFDNTQETPSGKFYGTVNSTNRSETIIDLNGQSASYRKHYEYVSEYGEDPLQYGNQEWQGAADFVISWDGTGVRGVVAFPDMQTLYTRGDLINDPCTISELDFDETWVKQHYGMRVYSRDCVGTNTEPLHIMKKLTPPYDGTAFFVMPAFSDRVYSKGKVIRRLGNAPTGEQYKVMGAALATLYDEDAREDVTFLVGVAALFSSPSSGRKVGAVEEYLWYSRYDDPSDMNFKFLRSYNIDDQSIDKAFVNVSPWLFDDSGKRATAIRSELVTETVNAYRPIDDYYALYDVTKLDAFVLILDIKELKKPKLTELERMSQNAATQKIDKRNISRKYSVDTSADLHIYDTVYDIKYTRNGKARMPIASDFFKGALCTAYLVYDYSTPAEYSTFGEYRQVLGNISTCVDFTGGSKSTVTIPPPYIEFSRFPAKVTPMKTYIDMSTNFYILNTESYRDFRSLSRNKQFCISSIDARIGLAVVSSVSSDPLTIAGVYDTTIDRTTIEKKDPARYSDRRTEKIYIGGKEVWSREHAVEYKAVIEYELPKNWWEVNAVAERNLCDVSGGFFISSYFENIGDQVKEYPFLMWLSQPVYMSEAKVIISDRYAYVLVSPATPTKADSMLFLINTSTGAVLKNINVSEVLETGKFRKKDVLFGSFSIVGVI